MNTIIGLRERTEADCVNKDNWAGSDDTRPDTSTNKYRDMTGFAMNLAVIAATQVEQPAPKNPAPKKARVKKGSSKTRRVDRVDLHNAAVVRYAEIVFRSQFPANTLKHEVPKRYRHDVAKLMGMA